MSTSLRVLIVDDHSAVRYGLVHAIAQDSRFEVCAEAVSVVDAREKTTSTRPDLMILDLMLGGRDGLELLRELLDLSPSTRVLVYSAQPELAYAARAFKAGACGYLMKDAGIEKIPEALATIAAGERYASGAVQRAMFQQVAAGRAAVPAPLDVLSDRELQVLRLLGAGRGTAEIAAQLSLSVKTVGTYRERLKDKLGVDSGRQLESRAAEFVRTGSL